MGEETNDYRPDPSSVSSILVTFFCLLSLLLSSSVVASLLSRRSQTSSSRLILLLNLSISLGTFSKFPFLYSGLACEFSGFVVNYCACQILIITYYQLNARNITHLISNTEIDDPADCQLSTKSLLIIALVPIIFGIFPITLFQYHRHGPWCELHASSASSSSVVLLTGYVLLWILELSLLYELFKLIRKIWKVPSDIFYLTIRRVLLGPALCATYTLVIFFCLDLVTIVTTLSHPSPIGNYYGDYTFTMLQYFLGMAYALTYYLEKNNLDELEAYFKELLEFEKAFRGSETTPGALDLALIPPDRLSDLDQRKRECL